MAARSEHPTDVPATAPRRRMRPKRAKQAAEVATVDASSLARSALEFAVHCHAGQRRPSDGSAFIEHPLEVARLVRDAGCSEVVIAAGLLHEVIEESRVSPVELSARFGADVADLVQSVTDHASNQSYRQRKRVLRDQVRSAGTDAALLFAADRISAVRELPDQIRLDRSRFDGAARGSRVRTHVEQYHQMRIEHYEESLSMLRRMVPQHQLVQRLAAELDNCRSVLPGGR